MKLGIALLSMVACSMGAVAAPLYVQDFESAKDGKVPEPPAGVMVLDGQFAVKEAEGNRFLELPGSPLETFGVLFGPNAAAGHEVQVRILGTKSGRKFPTFAAGLNGVNGFKVRVSPAKNAVELVQGDESKASAPLAWKSGEWTSLKLRVVAAGVGVLVTAKVWQGPTEPADWTLKLETTGLPAGLAGAWGMPFSGTPIRFDDLTVSRVP